jgi:hypothetical protein
MMAKKDNEKKEDRFSWKSGQIEIKLPKKNETDKKKK